MKTILIGILKGLGLISGQAIPILVAAVAPALLPLVEFILGRIFKAEATYGGGKGPDKLVSVLGSVEAAGALLVPALERAIGKELADEALLGQGVRKIVDGLVDVLNAFRVLTKTP